MEVIVYQLDERVVERAIARLADKNRATALENLFKLLYTDEMRALLKERKSKFPFSVRTAFDLACRLEGAIYYHSRKKQDYLKQVREKILLLKSKRSSNLKYELFEELLTADEFATKELSELEPEDQKKKHQISRDWFMKSVQSDFYLKNFDFKESEFTCFKCRGKKVYTTQKQMRSADEPMTT